MSRKVQEAENRMTPEGKGQRVSSTCKKEKKIYTAAELCTFSIISGMLDTNDGAGWSLFS